MSNLFVRQFGALVWKNGIVLARHPLLNILRCFVLPVAYGIFLAVAQVFLTKPNNYGIGSPIPVFNLSETLDPSLSLFWADATNGIGSPSPQEVMTHVTQGLSDKQRRAVRKAASADVIPASCPQNFNLFSECFAAVIFNSIPPLNHSDALPVNYTIRADGGLFHIDVVKHKSDYERRILPLQWAVDQAIMELRTGQSTPTPLQWPFTQETNEEQSTRTRLSYIRGLRSLLVIALFVCYVGIAYQLPGAFMGERAIGLTSHLKVMGLLDSARIISWHFSLSLAYFPAWLIVSLIWHFRIFTSTSAGLVFVIHFLLGLSLASWSFFVAMPFGKSPQLAAVVSTFFAIVLALIALVMGAVGSGTAFIYTILFPPGFYIFAIRTIAGFENHRIPTSVLDLDPDSQMRLLPILIAAIIDVFLWPWLAVLLERRLYDARQPSSGQGWWRFWRKKQSGERQSPKELPDGIAISVKSLQKTFKPSFFRRSRGIVTAIADLSFDIPKFGIFVLLGSNGAGKSTTLSILAGLLGRTSGSITFEGGVSHPPRGALGIVPQKNVLFPELTCYQTLRLWKAVKHSKYALAEDDDLEQLLRDCDLEKKIHANAYQLSGGQKRKLQLAIGLVGGSRIVLVDECTSGVDPLSRRALWRILTSVRHERTVVFTTHFLDEADLLADDIAILAAPGKLVAKGSPVSLKSSLGEGYTVTVAFEHAKAGHAQASTDLLKAIREVAPAAYLTVSPPNHASFHLKTRQTDTVENVLHLLDSEGHTHGVASYDIQGTSIEDIFLGLMHTPELVSKAGTLEEGTLSSSVDGTQSPAILRLTDGRKMSPFQHALTIFHKRALIARRSWLTPTLLVLVAIAGSCIPLFFIAGRPQSCTTTFEAADSEELYLPNSPLNLFQFSRSANILEAPPGITASLPTIDNVIIRNITDNVTFVQTIQQNYRNLSRGGISVDTGSRASLVAWEASPPGLMGPTLLNLASNILYNQALNASGSGSSSPNLIQANYQSFPAVDTGTLVALKWIGFFGAALAVYPAFFSLYVSRERRSSVQAMQFSNGLSNPMGLWLGHLMFDTVFVLFLSSIIVIVFSTASNQFHGLGFFWLILVLYGIAGALFAYCVSLATTSPLAAFAVAAAYQIIMFTVYVAAYLLTLTYAKTSQAEFIITTIHFTLSVLSPVASIIRTAFVSVNLFSLACTGSEVVTAAHLGTIKRFGGPILYLIIYPIVLFLLLVWVDSGSVLPRNGLLGFWKPSQQEREEEEVEETDERDPDGDVEKKISLETKVSDSLRVQNVTKTFGFGRNAKTVVDDVSLGVPPDTIFALLGPNGAGKTTTFNIIRGDVLPERGDVLLSNISVIRHPQSARLALGVCPQFTAIDSQMTVREHLAIYGRLKGIDRGAQLQSNVEALMEATGLAQYADRLASKLSGGNQRKLSLAIALIGNPSVILIDEFSTGIDAKMKREMWLTLRRVAVGKAIVITTHSMEEASALANKVGIIARKLLAVGTTESLANRYAVYEVHFSCRTREDVVRAQQLMAHIPGARMADDVATRFEVPIERNARGDDQLSLAQLFHLLASEGDFPDYTVERATLESVFLKVIRENDVREEDHERRKKRWCGI
ncbi:hypothetical protein OF83DRAFT_1100473 [Amylostereum chailletii]|nr:hypothetical protein OF83DRAFT_1100473 [Amylostereum chailletii]